MRRILLCRTDNLGDVILTLPMAGVLKQSIPGCQIFFLGKKYTRPLIEGCEYIDQFLDWDEIRESDREAEGTRVFSQLKADVVIHVFPEKEICRMTKEAGIPLRIATSHRWFSWRYCNKRVHYSRKKSDLHEAQLNLKLLRPLGIEREYSLSEIASLYGLSRLPDPQAHQFVSSSVADRCQNPEFGGIRPATGSPFRLILHPKSKGSAREWGLENFSKLIDLLPEDRFKIFITGTREEGDRMGEFLKRHHDRVTDLTGMLTLEELISFINTCDGIVAASTGPLHIAAALGKRAVGIYAPMRPIFPRRWAPIGRNADYLVLEKECSDCRHSTECACIKAIPPEEVVKKILR